MPKTPLILCVNPWITDFAAHDLWARPLGLLFLVALLREGGCGVAFVDCLSRRDPETLADPRVIPGRPGKYATGRYPKVASAPPPVYEAVARPYFRYGITRESLRKKLFALPRRPNLVLVTSAMTYWYPGVRETIAEVRAAFPETPVWLGGVYARLCPEHARAHSGAHEVITDPESGLPARIEAQTGFSLKNAPRWGDFSAWPSPAFDLLAAPAGGAVLASLGCPNRCPYCASHLLQPHMARRTPEALARDILCARDALGARDIAFHDDALLFHAETLLDPALSILRAAGATDLRFHTPNALHVRGLTERRCAWLREAGFTTLRLGLETTNARLQQAWGEKAGTGEFLQAVENLRAAGFAPRETGVYLLAGLPGESPDDVSEAVALVREAGAAPHLCEYSPIPGTALFPEAAALSPYDLSGEPLTHNNTFFACARPGFTREDMARLKALARAARASLSPGAR